MSSLERLLSILDLYTEAEPIWTLEEITLKTGYARSTAYRYVKELCDSGLLISIGRGAHVLGPRFIEFDRQIRNCDPLLMAAQKIVPSLYKKLDDGLVSLCSLYGDKVLSIHQEPWATNLEFSFTRGRPMPLFYGATAKIILANLPERQLVKLFLNHRIEIAKAGLGEEWEDFKEALAEIRRNDFCITHSEIDPGLIGVGSAVFADDKKVIASLTYITEDRGQMIEGWIPELLVKCSAEITEELASILVAYDEDLRRFSPVIPFKRLKAGGEK
ncbi:MAG: IclR family transcriptional regulator [Rhodospirillaceae bacterium]|jgi:DNA-binding IclR family transcriptional regulator|nr:IclR family transcriptional regulator [Rhodospirillaceae bacterium]